MLRLNTTPFLSAELLPTSLRTTGLGLFSACGRIGSILSQYSNGALLPIRAWAPVCIGSGAMLVGAAAVARLPRETSGQPMSDEVGEGEGAGGGGESEEEEGLLVAR